MKLIAALWRADPTLLLGADLRTSLQEAGATRLQVNLDDEHVASAQLRLSSWETAPDAVVSVWDGDEQSVLRSLSEVGESLSAWRVTAYEPLVPPRVPDGRRAEALANVAFLRRPADLDHAEWRSRWLDHHTAVAIATQATFGYVQNEVVEQVAGEPRHVAAVVEELFPVEALTDWHAFYGSDGSDAELGRRMEAMMASVSRFGADRQITLVPTTRRCFDLVGDEQVRPVPQG